MHTSHAGNVGAAARAMKVMGFDDLVLVRPRFADVLSHEEAAGDGQRRGRRAGAGAHRGHAGRRTRRRRVRLRHGHDAARLRPAHARAARVLFETLAQAPQRVAFVFGGERHGLANEDVYRCHACLSIPADPAYGSLNLAQAVQLIAYDWRQALGGFEVQPRAPEGLAADVAAVQGALAHWQEVLVDIGYLDPEAPKKLMPRLNQLANRARLTGEEIHILRGIARAVAKLKP